MGDIQQDPSMEEILASIKRVIREDGGLPPSPRAARKPSPTEPIEAADDDVLELDDPVDGGESLVSNNAAAASRQSLAALNALRPEPAAPAADGGALENAVRDMLRPMLKDWLDEHLPRIVEELVTREISRITGNTS